MHSIRHSIGTQGALNKHSIEGGATPASLPKVVFWSSHNNPPTTRSNHLQPETILASRPKKRLKISFSLTAGKKTANLFGLSAKKNAITRGNSLQPVFATTRFSNVLQPKHDFGQLHPLSISIQRALNRHSIGTQWALNNHSIGTQ
jgi:hypothetical protein